MRVLLVKGDQTRADGLPEFLKASGTFVDTVGTGNEAVGLVDRPDYDVVLLDLTLRDMPGSTLISQMRAAGCHTPVLAISAYPSAEPTLRAFGAGADDVVTWPIDHEELLARMYAVARRRRGHSRPTLQVGALTLDIDREEIVANGKVISLTGKEFAILHLLVLRKNTILTKTAILSGIYGGINEPEPKFIEVVICKVRKKLAHAGVPDLVSSVRGRGYTVRDLPHDRGSPAQPLVPRPAQHVTRQRVSA